MTRITKLKDGVYKVNEVTVITEDNQIPKEANLSFIERKNLFSFIQSGLRNLKIQSTIAN